MYTFTPKGVGIVTINAIVLETSLLMVVKQLNVWLVDFQKLYLIVSTILTAFTDKLIDSKTDCVLLNNKD